MSRPKGRNIMWPTKVIINYNLRVPLLNYIIVQRLNMILYLVSYSMPIHNYTCMLNVLFIIIFFILGNNANLCCSLFLNQCT